MPNLAAFRRDGLEYRHVESPGSTIPAMMMVRDALPRAEWFSSWPSLCEMVECHTSRHDTFTVADAVHAMRTRETAMRQIVVHLVEADLEAHAADSALTGKGVDIGRAAYEAEITKTDAHARTLWNACVAYRKCTMVLLTDHGRTRGNWRKHGDDEDSRRAWALVVGGAAGVVDRRVSFADVLK